MHRTIWQALLGTTVLGCLTLFFLLAASPYSPARLIHTHTKTNITDDDDSEYFQWRTKSAFQHVTKGASKTAAVEELCKSFPVTKLDGIQPVLKTGHGALDRVRAQLHSSAACLDNLLIFSDMDEIFEGRQIYDTISDTPINLIDSDDQTLPYRRLKQYTINGTLSSADQKSLPGWETDKFKFLPDISRAWHMRPNMNWYIFFEGDTYILWDTVFRLLAHFNPDSPHYFGSPSPGREGIWFANGGPGFILSRAAMRNLVRADYEPFTKAYLGSKLAERHWHETLLNCCGDSILGWALWEEGVKLEGLWPMFNPHPLHGVPFSELYWCQPVVSLHKPHLEDMERLWRWEWRERRRERPMLYRDLALTFYKSFRSHSIRENWDNADWDGFEPPAYQAAHTSIERCQAACEAHNLCFQWTYHLRKCWFVRSFRAGGAKEPVVGDEEHRVAGQDWDEADKRFVAGWDTKKIGKWIEERPCREVQWVKPSTERIF